MINNKGRRDPKSAKYQPVLIASNANDDQPRHLLKKEMDAECAER